MQFGIGVPGVSRPPRMPWLEVGGFEPRPDGERRCLGALYGFAPHPRQSAERHAAERIFPNLRAWWGVVARLGLSDAEALRIAAVSQRNGTNFGAEARASGKVSERELAIALADELDLAAQPDVDPRLLLISDQQALVLLRSSPDPMLVRCHDGVQACLLAATDRIAGLRRSLQVIPALPRQLCLAPAGALRRALVARVSVHLARVATFDLLNRYPAYSAQPAFNGWQGFVAGTLACVLPIAALMWPSAFLMALHVFSTFFFFACILLRLLPLAAGTAQPRVARPTW